MTERDIPANWDWGIGESSENYYDYWAYEVNDNYELHMYWDKGHKHRVEVLPINGFDKYNDPVYGYSERKKGFDTQEEAEEYAQELMEEL